MTRRTTTGLVATLALLAAAAVPAFAQDESGAIKALILPMLAEVAPGPAAEVFTDCIIAAAEPAEIAVLAAASGPSTEIGALINTVLARPDTLACAAAAAQ
jgi:hypothetical protein